MHHMRGKAPGEAIALVYSDLGWSGAGRNPRENILSAHLSADRVQSRAERSPMLADSGSRTRRPKDPESVRSSTPSSWRSELG